MNAETFLPPAADPQAISAQVTSVAPEAATPSPFEALHDQMQQLWRQLHFQGRTVAKQSGKTLNTAGERLSAASNCEHFLRQFCACVVLHRPCL